MSDYNKRLEIRQRSRRLYRRSHTTRLSSGFEACLAAGIMPSSHATAHAAPPQHRSCRLLSYNSQPQQQSRLGGVLAMAVVMSQTACAPRSSKNAREWRFPREARLDTAVWSSARGSDEVTAHFLAGSLLCLTSAIEPLHAGHALDGDHDQVTSSLSLWPSRR